METIDPATSLQLPPDAIQRVLFISPKVHVYNIPPLTSTKGYNASTWTADNNQRMIFMARLRVLETAIPSPATGSSREGKEKLKTDVLLEDPSTGNLFAAAPYTIPQVVEQVLDSSRFFAIRVQGEGGRKAVLGIGFEERGEAFDFSVALQEARRALGMDGQESGNQPSKKAEMKQQEEKRDFSLKEGEMITIDLGGRKRQQGPASSTAPNDKPTGFSLPPPPSYTSHRAGLTSLLSPPPSAQEVRAQQRISSSEKSSIASRDEDSGFDDGEFGEFQ